MWNIRVAKFSWQIDYRLSGGNESIYTPHKQHSGKHTDTDIQYVGNSVIAKHVSIVTDVDDLAPRDTAYL